MMVKIKSIQLNKIFLFSTILLGCFPILSFGMRSFFTIIWSCLGIYLFFLERKTDKLDSEIIYFLLPYLFITISIFYSTNIEYGLGKLIKMLSFIIFPLIFYLNRDFFSKKYVYQILDFFLISVLILVFYQIIIIFFNFDFVTSTLSLSEIKANGFNSLNEISNEKLEQIKLRRFRNYIKKISNTHSTYQGLWVGFSIFYLGLKSFDSKNKIFKIVSLVLIIFLFSWLFLISARMPFFALIISLILTVFLFFKISSSNKLLLISLPIFFLLSLLSFKNPISLRIKEYYQTGTSLLEKSSIPSEYNSSNVRNGIYFCDLKLIKEKSFLGVGIGDIQDELNTCYKEIIGAKIYTWHAYNSHNQFAFFWIASGFFGLLSFILLIIISFRKAFKNKNYILFFISSITFFIFMSENLLERSDGLFFYCFLISLLFFNKIKK